MNELLDLCHRGKLVTDKYMGELQFHSYIENFYGNLFPPRKERTLTLLEIGIAGGGSLWLWEEYFKNAHIYAIDPDHHMHLKFERQPRIHTFVGDAYDPLTIASIHTMFDIIIDDGPHTLDSQIKFIDGYLPKVNPGGLLIIEDIASEAFLSILGEHIPDQYQNRIHVHDTCGQDKRFDSRILWIET